MNITDLSLFHPWGIIMDPGGSRL